MSREDDATRTGFLDPHDQELLANVRPTHWRKPQPAERYDMLVIGAGTAGLVTAAAAAGLGARVALVERHLMGGDCLNYGCVPSKALLRAGRAVADAREAHRYGVVHSGGLRVRFDAVMERMRRLRASLSRHDSAERFRSLGVDVFLGEGRFVDRGSLRVDGSTLRFKRACVATGARAAAPDIPGLADTGYLTNETVFSLTELPRRIAVIGAGPIGCELAQAFQRFGSQVVQLEALPRILVKDDHQAAAIVLEALVADGVDVRVGAAVTRVERTASGKRVHAKIGASMEQLDVDEILVAVGRLPNVSELNLDAAGVSWDSRRGIEVDHRLRTTNRRIFAAGDVCSRFQFTHVADAMARIVVRNALFLGRASTESIIVPWVTYTDPEIAHVGLYPHDALERGIAVQTFEQRFSQVDRAVLDGEESGFAKVYVRSGRDAIVGGTVVARHAGEMIGELALAIRSGVGMKTLSDTVHPYPTQAEAFRKLGDAYNKTRLTPLVRSLMRHWLAWRL